MSVEDFKRATLTLDMTLDDIEDLPGFVTPLTGAYTVAVESAGIKSINERSAFEVGMKIEAVQELVEQAGVGDDTPKPGDMFSQMWFLDNKVAVDQMKKFLAPIAERLNTKNMGEIAAGAKGMQLLVIVKREQDKENKTKFYARVKHVSVI